jgi:intracellular sulfur oxidation DsrE/DsrF family protein
MAHGGWRSAFLSRPSMTKQGDSMTHPHSTSSLRRRLATFSSTARSTQCLLAFLLLLGPAAARAQASTAAAVEPAPRYRVVMQVSNLEPRGWNQALNNALALTRNAGKANVQIEIVAIGAGIGLLKYNSPFPKEINAVLGVGVKVIACGETMKALMLEKDDMLPNISYVPGGLIEVLDRQHDGWQYVKGD